MLLRYLLAAVALLVSPIAVAQTTYQTGRPSAEQNPLPTKSMCWSGSTYAPCGASGASSVPTGTAGSPSSSVLSVQGITGGTSLNTNLSAALPAGANNIGSVNVAAGGTALTAGVSSNTAIANNISTLTTNSLGRLWSGSSWAVAAGTSGGEAYVMNVPASSGTVGVAANATAAVAAGHVLKSSAGNLYGLTVTSGATAGYVMIFNSTSVPADGAVTPTKCVALAASSSLVLDFRGAPLYHSTGTSVAFSTTGCFTKTGSATAYISGEIK